MLASPLLRRLLQGWESRLSHQCEHCGTILIVHFGCNSRICSNCGKNHTDIGARSLQNALWGVHHRNTVLTIPDDLWTVVRNNRFILRVLMDAAIAAINDTISHKQRNGRLTAGAVVVLHPFSKKMSFNLHFHIIVAEGGFYRHGRFSKYISREIQQGSALSCDIKSGRARRNCPTSSRLRMRRRLRRASLTTTPRMQSQRSGSATSSTGSG